MTVNMCSLEEKELNTNLRHKKLFKINNYEISLSFE